MASETLFYIFQNDPFLINGRRVAYLNALFHSDLSAIDTDGFIFQQVFKPYVDELEQAGFNVLADVLDDRGLYDVVCMILPKNIIEARYWLGRGAALLKSGGLMVCAADNKAGGSRLQKLMQDFGVVDLNHESRNKARVVWGKVQDVDQDAFQKSQNAGQAQKILEGRFFSQSGIFGWDKVDKGSEILTRCLPADIKGKGADFGCGYGYLSDFLLSKYRKVKQLTCIDADYRAVELCRKNLERYECQKTFLWRDLTKLQDDVRNLDFIIMNPPFHEGKKSDLSLGHRFIDAAHQSLRRGGRLFIVANNHLAYEKYLEDKFFTVQKLHEGQGFKVFEALK